MAFFFQKEKSLNHQYVKIWPPFCQSPNRHSLNRRVILFFFFFFFADFLKIKMKTVAALLNQQMQRQLMLRDEFNREQRVVEGLRQNVSHLEQSLTRRQIKMREELSVRLFFFYKIQSKSFICVYRNISALVGCIKKLMALYEVQLLKTFQIGRLDFHYTVPEKSYRDQSCEYCKRHPENATFHPMISWVYNNHYVILIFHLVFL